jgi:hypothetical protein
MTLLTALLALLLPRMLAETPTDPWTLAAVRASWVLIPLLFVGLPCSFLDLVLVSAMKGDVNYIRWSGSALVTVALSGVRWLACFLAGPILFAGFGVLYWLNCGDLAPFDWLSLAELYLVALAYQVFALLSLTDRGRVRDLNPLTVIDLAHRLGWRAMVVGLLAACLLLAHGWLLIAGVALVHTEVLSGFAILASSWLSGVFWSTFFCRLLGIQCYRSRRALAA